MISDKKTKETLRAQRTGADVVHTLAEWVGGSAAADTFAAAACEWLGERVLLGQVSLSALRREAYIIRVHLVPVLGERPVAMIDAQALREVLDRPPLGERARRALVRVLLAVFAYAVARGLRPDNPAQALLPVSPLPAPGKALTPTEEAAVLAQLDAPLRALFVLLIETGARLGELLALRREDVDLAAATITLGPQVLAAGNWLLWHAPDRVVDLSARARAVLEELMEAGPAAGQGWLFADAQGRLYRVVRIRARLRDAMRQAGVAGACSCTRRTCAARWLRAGRPAQEVAAQLGLPLRLLDYLVGPLDGPHA